MSLSLADYNESQVLNWNPLPNLGEFTQTAVRSYPRSSDGVGVKVGVAPDHFLDLRTVWYSLQLPLSGILMTQAAA